MLQIKSHIGTTKLKKSEEGKCQPHLSAAKAASRAFNNNVTALHLEHRDGKSLLLYTRPNTNEGLHEFQTFSFNFSSSNSSSLKIGFPDTYAIEASRNLCSSEPTGRENRINRAILSDRCYCNAIVIIKHNLVLCGKESDYTQHDDTTSFLH